MMLPEQIDWDCRELDQAAQASLFYRRINMSSLADRTTVGLVYLATPYSKISMNRSGGWSAQDSEYYGQAAADWAAMLAQFEISVFAPIAQISLMINFSVHGVLAFSNPRSTSPPGRDLEFSGLTSLSPPDDAFWSAWCAPFRDACSCVVVPPVVGWRESRGIWREVRTAISRNKPVYIMRGDT